MSEAPAQTILQDMLAKHPALEACKTAVLALHAALVQCYDNGGKLLLCGNGGSHADSVHIVGELCKSFERKRPLPAALAEKLAALPMGEALAGHLEAGLAAIALGCNGPLKTAVENDSPLRDIAFAQEACALVKPEDVILGISTSGNAENCLMALSISKALGATTAALTGPRGGKLAAFADIALKAPGASTSEIQESHIILYHATCKMIEAHYYPEPRA